MSTPPGTSTPKIKAERLFSQIGDSDVYISHPLKDSEEQLRSKGKPPSVILICGWMDAQLPHLYKYTEHYHKLYPSATQILIRSHQKYFWKGNTAKRASVFPAVKLLRDSGINGGDPARSSGLLVHTFSNGGALVLTSLARAFGEIPLSIPAQSALPAQALVYDSLPGAISLRVTVLAFTAPIRSAPLRAVAKVVFATAYIVGAIWRRTISLFFGKSKDTFGRLHDDLNDSKLLPQHVPRTYVYSDADELIPIDVVEGHAKKTKELLESDGVNSDIVKLVKFEGSSHVAHARKDPQRYWKTVVETWEASWRK